MIYTIVLSLLLTFPALSLIEILHVKKFTKLWTIIMVIFGCLSFNLEVFFLNIIVSYTFAFITAIIYYYVAIYQSVKKEMWNEIARELYDSKEDLERFKLDFERHTEMTLESFKDKAKCFTHEKVTEFKFNGFKLSIQDNFHTLYKLKK